MKIIVAQLKQGAIKNIQFYDLKFCTAALAQCNEKPGKNLALSINIKTN